MRCVHYNQSTTHIITIPVDVCQRMWYRFCKHMRKCDFLNFFIYCSFHDFACTFLLLTHEYIFKEPVWETEGCCLPCFCSWRERNSTSYGIPIAWRGCTLFFLLQQIQALDDKMHLAAVACIHDPFHIKSSAFSSPWEWMNCSFWCHKHSIWKHATVALICYMHLFFSTWEKFK